MRAAAVVLGVFAIIAFVNGESYEDEIAEQKHYCKMIASGAWPNFKGIDCDETK